MNIPIYNTVLNRKSNFSNLFIFLTDFLGEKVYNATGHVIAARSTQLYWNVAMSDVVEAVTSQGSGIELEHADSLTLEWEAEFIKIGRNTNLPGVELLVNGGRSFGDVSADAILFDGFFLAGGYLIMFVYTVLMLGRINAVEVRLYLSIVGIICIGMGLIISLGLTMALGYPYTPMHAALPFIALGKL
jgi:predicted RND superfamily exporter protein